MRPGPGACVAAALALLVSLHAGAQTREVSLRYSAPPACPSRAEFEQRVRVLTPRASFVDGAAVAQRFEVHVEIRGERRFVGTLRAGTEGGARVVEAEGCEELIGAMALVAAIAIDPAVMSTPSARRVTPSPIARSTRPRPRPRPRPRSRPRPRPRRRPRSRPRPRPRRRRRPPTPTPVAAPTSTEVDRAPARPSTWQLALAVGAETRTSPAPTPDVRCGRPSRAFGPGRRSRLPSSRASPTTAGRPASHASSSWPARPAPASNAPSVPPWRSAPACSSTSGRSDATGLQVAHPGDASRLWGDVSALARGRLGLGGAFHADASLGPSLSLTRPTYVFENPYVVVHQVPLLGLYASVTAGATFW